MTFAKSHWTSTKTRNRLTCLRHRAARTARECRPAALLPPEVSPNDDDHRQESNEELTPQSLVNTASSPVTGRRAIVKSRKEEWWVHRIGGHPKMERRQRRRRDAGRSIHAKPQTRSSRQPTLSVNLIQRRSTVIQQALDLGAIPWQDCKCPQRKRVPNP